MEGSTYFRRSDHICDASAASSRTHHDTTASRIDAVLGRVDRVGHVGVECIKLGAAEAKRSGSAQSSDVVAAEALQ